MLMNVVEIFREIPNVRWLNLFSIFIDLKKKLVKFFLVINKFYEIDNNSLMIGFLDFLNQSIDQLKGQNPTVRTQSGLTWKIERVEKKFSSNMPKYNFSR